MATSRRRERELARRRYERRRLREQQKRARRRRRNVILGAGTATAAVIVVIVLLAVNLGGGKAKVAASATPTPTPSSTVTPTPTAVPAAPTKCAPIKPNPPAKGDPVVPPVVGKVPKTLVVKDIKKGTGPVAKKGSTISVNYVGVSCSTGTSFDASYPRHQTFDVTLGQHKVIPGWDQGLVGMRQGGRRELIIPASMGYGTTGQGSIKPNETLIFVVDLVKVKK